jgi:hypothetical protein
MEMEKGVKRHYEFLVSNLTDKPVTVYLNSQFSCTCTRLKVLIGMVSDAERPKLAALKELPVGPHLEPYLGGIQWNYLEYDPTRGPSAPVTFPGSDANGPAFAVVRMAWETTDIKTTTLKAELIGRQGSAADRLDFEVPITVTAPVLSSTSPTDTLYLGDINPGERKEASFFLWSPTRDKFDANVELSVPDPCITVSPPRPLSAAELKSLPAELAAKAQTTAITNPKCAYEIKVSVSEHVGDHQLELGPFSRRIVVNRGTETELVIGLAGTIRGPIRVGDAVDRDRIDLRVFRADQGAGKTVNVTSAVPTMQLTVDHVHPDSVQAELVQIKTAAGAPAGWKLTVVVPPNAQAGPLPADAAIYLKMNTNPPRRVRIPVGGNASG